MSAIGLTAAPSKPARANGWWGMAILLASESMLIGALAGSYFYLRFNSAHWPPRGTPAPALVAPIALTLVLAATLLPYRAALRAARRGERRRALGLVALATVTQAAYLGVQIHLFIADLTRLQPQQSAYASIYYVLLGAAHAHVAVGLLLDVWLLARLSERLTPYRVVAVDVITLYWSVVVVLTTAVTATVLSPWL